MPSIFKKLLRKILSACEPEPAVPVEDIEYAPEPLRQPRAPSSVYSRATNDHKSFGVPSSVRSYASTAATRQPRVTSSVYSRATNDHKSFGVPPSSVRSYVSACTEPWWSQEAVDKRIEEEFIYYV
ncbi:MAG: hypothetical protein Q9208_001879 [Pyrenodesmia sp. 3 TL-2023]